MYNCLLCHAKNRKLKKNNLNFIKGYPNICEGDDSVQIVFASLVNRDLASIVPQELGIQKCKHEVTNVTFFGKNDGKSPKCTHSP